MLVLGICNPRGEHDTYNGLYFKSSELRQMVDSQSLNGLPIRAEHGEGDLGTIVSSYVRSDGALQCLFEVPGNDIEQKIAQGFVRDGVALELSMGYTVDVQQSSDMNLTAGAKRTVEVSLVKKGARDGCHVLAFQDTDLPVQVRRTKQEEKNKQVVPAHDADGEYFALFRS